MNLAVTECRLQFKFEKIVRAMSLLDRLKSKVKCFFTIECVIHDVDTINVDQLK